MKVLFTKCSYNKTENHILTNSGFLMGTIQFSFTYNKKKQYGLLQNYCFYYQPMI